MPEAFEEAREVIADLHRIVTPDGVQENYQLRAGGVDHWVYARGRDRSNPVILFVHGGPASPLAPTAWQFQRPIEEHFTVVTYDQRAAGRHSNRPELFHAYVGVGQVINARANEQLCFEYALDQAREHNHTEALEQLASIAPYPGDEPVTRERIIIARQWAQYRGGLSAYRDDSQYFFGAPELSPEYTVEESDTIGEGNEFTLGRVLDEMLAVDYTGVTEFPIPVLMFLGRHDYTTPAQPPAEWIEAVEAPYKQAVWFEHSAHLAPWEEPGKFLVSLLTYVRPLSV